MIEIGVLFGAYLWASALMAEAVYTQAVLHDWRLNIACDVWTQKTASHKRMSAFGSCVSTKKSGRAQRRAERVAQ
jgi:hypothetical protein